MNSGPCSPGYTSGISRRNISSCPGLKIWCWTSCGVGAVLSLTGSPRPKRLPIYACIRCVLHSVIRNPNPLCVGLRFTISRKKRTPVDPHVSRVASVKPGFGEVRLRAEPFTVRRDSSILWKPTMPLWPPICIQQLAIRVIYH